MLFCLGKIGSLCRGVAGGQLPRPPAMSIERKDDMQVYINPFWLGVLATVWVEVVALIIVAVVQTKKGGKKHD